MKEEELRDGAVGVQGEGREWDEGTECRGDEGKRTGQWGEGGRKGKGRGGGIGEGR